MPRSDRQAANERRPGAVRAFPSLFFFSSVSAASESEKNPLKPTGSVPRKRTGATLSPCGQAGALNGFMQETREEGARADGSQEGTDRAPGRVASPGGVSPGGQAPQRPPVWARKPPEGPGSPRVHSCAL